MERGSVAATLHTHCAATTLRQLVGLIAVPVIVVMVGFVAVSDAQESSQRKQDYNDQGPTCCRSVGLA